MKTAITTIALMAVMALPAMASDEPMPFEDYAAYVRSIGDGTREGKPDPGTPEYLDWAQAVHEEHAAIAPEDCYATQHARIVEHEGFLLTWFTDNFEAITAETPDYGLLLGLTYELVLLYPDMAYPVESEEGTIRLGPDEQIDLARYLSEAECAS